MKLVSCHIENYGKLSNVDFDFNSGITEFYLENGEGKTTLASFIKAMFYGLPTYTSSEKTFGDRKHYLPFSGGVFGGNSEIRQPLFSVSRYKERCIAG